MTSDDGISSEPHAVLYGPRVRLRPISEGDFVALRGIIDDPTVARWWGDYTDEDIRDEFIGRPEVPALVIEVEGAARGFIQYSEELDDDYRHAGIDIALGSEAQGRGLGPEAIRVLARYLFDVRGHHRLTIDPAVANGNAILAYERVGFRRVGAMRQYERGPDGVFHDGLLMDMLRGEMRS